MSFPLENLLYLFGHMQHLEIESHVFANIFNLGLTDKAQTNHDWFLPSSSGPACILVLCWKRMFFFGRFWLLLSEGCVRWDENPGADRGVVIYEPFFVIRMDIILLKLFLFFPLLTDLQLGVKRGVSVFASMQLLKRPLLYLEDHLSW